ncbi:MAG TPA: hypothetical protein VIH37_03695 [Candidatus Limnocylindrales bacterium]
MPADRWATSALVREAVCNVASWRARLFPVLILAVLMGAGGVAFAAGEALSLDHQVVELQAQGRLVIDITSVDPKRPVAIDRTSCEALSTQPDVTRAGLAVPSGFSDIGQLGTGVGIVAVSNTLFPQIRHTDVLVGSALRASVSDFRLLMPDGRVAQARMLAIQPRGLDVNSAILVGLDPTVTTGPSCRVVFDPHADPTQVIGRALASVQEVGDQPLVASTAYAENINPVTAYQHRPTRLLPLLLGLLGGFAAAMVNRARVGELATYRLSGTSRRSLALLLGLEQCFLAGTLATAGALAALALTAYPISRLAASLASVAAAAIWILTAMVLSIDIPLRRPTDLAKDR